MGDSFDTPYIECSFKKMSAPAPPPQAASAVAALWRDKSPPGGSAAPFGAHYCLFSYLPYCVCMFSLLKKRSLEQRLHDLLPKLLAKKSLNNNIPMSGTAAQRNDYYIVYFGKKYLVDGYDSNKRLLNVRALDEKGAYTINERVTLSATLQYPINVTYFYKNYWKEYTKIGILAFDYRMRCVQIVCTWDKFTQWIYNRKPLWVIRNRMDLLERIIKRQFEQEGSGERTNFKKPAFTAFDIMNEVYSSNRLFDHPDYEARMMKISLFLDAFVYSGELKKQDNIRYTTTEKAIQTLGDYQESQRRHQDAIKTQQRIFLLTVVIAIAAAVQAYFTAFPPN